MSVQMTSNPSPKKSYYVQGQVSAEEKMRFKFCSTHSKSIIPTIKSVAVEALPSHHGQIRPTPTGIFATIYHAITGHDQWIPLEIGEGVFIKINYNSLKKNLGLTDEELNGTDSASIAKTINNKVNRLALEECEKNCTQFIGETNKYLLDFTQYQPEEKTSQCLEKTQSFINTIHDLNLLLSSEQSDQPTPEAATESPLIKELTSLRTSLEERLSPTSPIYIKNNCLYVLCCKNLLVEKHGGAQHNLRLYSKEIKDTVRSARFCLSAIRELQTLPINQSKDPAERPFEEFRKSLQDIIDHIPVAEWRPIVLEGVTPEKFVDMKSWPKNQTRQ